MNKMRLGEVLDIRRGTSLSGKYYSENGDLIRLTLGNFSYPNGGFKENKSKKDIYFTGKVDKKFIMHKGDIITPLTEQVIGLLGETAFIPEDNKYIQSGDIGLIVPNMELLDKKYCYYLISSNFVKSQLSIGAQQTKIRHTSPNKIKECIVILPDLKTQAKIGDLLFKIDNQIKKNEAMVQKLQLIVITHIISRK